MPSTRGGGRADVNEGLPMDYSSDEFDPDYRESSDDSDDELPQSMHRDRAQWIVDNQEDIEFLYRVLLDTGRSTMGGSFLQLGNVTTFGNFLYRNTTPFSDTTPG